MVLRQAPPVASWGTTSSEGEACGGGGDASWWDVGRGLVVDDAPATSFPVGTGEPPSSGAVCSLSTPTPPGPAPVAPSECRRAAVLPTSPPPASPPPSPPPPPPPPFATATSPVGSLRTASLALSPTPPSTPAPPSHGGPRSAAGTPPLTTGSGDGGRNLPGGSRGSRPKHDVRAARSRRRLSSSWNCHARAGTREGETRSGDRQCLALSSPPPSPQSPEFYGDQGC